MATENLKMSTLGGQWPGCQQGACRGDKIGTGGLGQSRGGE